MSIQSLNPVSGKLVKKYAEESEKKFIGKIEKAQKAWLGWRSSSFQQRASLLLNAAKVLRECKTDLASLMAIEMGKPVKAGILEIEKCALVCEYYAENGEKFLKDELIKT